VTVISGTKADPQERVWLLGQVLALLLLGACAGWVWRHVAYLVPQDVYTAPFGFRAALASRLGGQLAAFTAALVFVHALLGVASSFLALLTRSAFPRAASPVLLAAAWFVALTGLAFAANSSLFPTSVFAGRASTWGEPIAGLLPVAWLTILLAAAVLALALRAIRRTGWHWRWTTARVALLVVAAVVAALAWLSPQSLATHGAAVAPNIVIIGIDSLRNDLQIPRRGAADVPNVRAFMAGARRFSDATTPLARTYASWVSILTGRHPVTTNARYNLMPRRLVREGDTLGEALRAHGYRATYATDETRFANFDPSFGFDQLIKPPTGAIDFLASYAGDMPLVNLVAATPAGGLLFPANRANRAANVTYRPRDFVRRLEREIRVDGPTFLAIHLTLAHWPYAWGGIPVPARPEDYRTSYDDAIRTADRQFADVLAVLADAGVLDNAIVVLLSDHGEALGADDDSIIRKTGTAQQIWDSLWGHGTSVLSPHQYQVLLAMRAYGRAKLPGPEGNYDWPVTLEDLRPTLEELATGTPPAGVDGISLVPYMAEPGLASTLQNRIRFTETDLNTASLQAGRFEASAIAEEAAAYYELDPASGWVQLRETRLPALIARKQRAALSRGGFLAALPAQDGGPARVLFSNRQAPLPRILEGPPADWPEDDARRLLEALESRYPGELPMPAGLP
jgi:arylsulfatase A-like enzyme